MTKTARRRLEVRRALARYPHLPSSTVDDLVHWFKQEATANEVAAMMRQLDSQDSFGEFRRAHIDRADRPNVAARVAAASIVMVAIAFLAIGVVAF